MGKVPCARCGAKRTHWRKPGKKSLKQRSRAGRAFSRVGRKVGWKPSKTVRYERIDRVLPDKRQMFQKQQLEDAKSRAKAGLGIAFRIPYHPPLACSSRRGTKFTNVVKGSEKTALRPFFVAGNYVQLPLAKKRTSSATR